MGLGLDQGIVTAGSSQLGTAVGAVVLGMGRSGTSAVTGALVAAGFYAGGEAPLRASAIASAPMLTPAA